MAIRVLRLSCAVVLLTGCCGVLSGQSNLMKRNTLTNRDVITLARAGFDENFLVDVILSSPRQFDTSAPALAALAEQGITQHIVEVMMNPVGTTGEPTAQNNAPPAGAMASAPPAARTRPVSGHPAPGATCYVSRSILWGVWKKTVGTAAPTAAPATAGSATSSGRYLPIGATTQQPAALLSTQPVETR